MRVQTSLVAAVVVLAAVAGAVSATGSTGATSDIQCEFPVTETDATGQEVTVEAEPERIVTLNPSAAQTMWEIGGKDKVVGVSKYATYLEGAESKQNISGGGQTFVSVEKVVGLEPDLVLAPNTISNDTVGKLREAGLTVYRFGFQTSIEDIKQKTLLTGRLTGECDGAEETVAWMDEKLDTVAEAIEGESRPPTLYVFFGYTGGEGTFAHRIIEAGGGTNIAAEANLTGYKQISQEIVVEYNPEWIVVNDGAPGIPQNDVYNETYAVKNDQIVVLQEEHISQPAPRIVLAVETLAKALHSEAYERAAMETATPSPTATEIETATPSPTATEIETATPSPATTESATETATGMETGTATDTPASAPGFGVGATAIAFAVAVLLFGRFRV